MNHIGLFFYVKDEIYTKTYALQEAISQGGFLIPPEGHDRVWREKYEAQEGTSYDYWPRGRVAYNTTSRSYCMYHDGCLSEVILEQAKKAFGIDEAVVRCVKDDYYTCKECMKKLSDDEDFLDSF